MDVIVIFDLYAYGGHKQMVEVVAVPKGSTDQQAFDAWAAGRPGAETSHAFLSTELRILERPGPWLVRMLRWVKGLWSL
jgi:hypothetical protein